MFVKLLTPRQSCLFLVKRFYEPIRIKNIYKELDYSAPFTDTEKAESLKLINDANDLEAMQEILPKKYSAKILNHKLKVGNFEVIEELLDVKGIETNILERILSKLHKPKNTTSSKQKKIWDKTLSGFTPRLTEQLTIPKTVIGLRFNLLSVSYALFEDKQLVEIKSFKHDEDILEGKNAFESHNLLHLTASIIENLPASDVITVETLTKIIPNDKLLTVKMNNNLLEASLFARLDCQTPKPNIYKFKYNLKSSLFNLQKVGQERTKIHPQLERILSDLRTERTVLGMDEKLCENTEVLDEFLESGLVGVQEYYDKEQQSEAFLSGLAFLHMLEYLGYKSQ